MMASLSRSITLLCICVTAVSTFTVQRDCHNYGHLATSRRRGFFIRTSNSDVDTESASPDHSSSIVDRSTLTLLEHINFNIPSHEFAIPFYYDILGCGFDPRMADNLENPADGSAIWANCGASQFHLCYNGTEPTLQGRIGLRYDSLDELQNRVQEHEQSTNKDNRCFQTYTIGKDTRGNKQIILIDRYDNEFVCQIVQAPLATAPASLKQPIVAPVDCYIPSLNMPGSESAEWEKIVSRFGKEATDCRGVTFVEMDCPRGRAEDIATFYESVFDATTFVVPIQEHKIAMIAFGNINEEGRADQYLLFRETYDSNMKNTGHHIAMYVGEDHADFQQAYKYAEMAGIIWINPRFANKVDSLSTSKQEMQFRFKDIVDLRNGKTIMELEHEIRSSEHKSYPGHQN